MCLQGAIQAAVKPADCGLIVQNNTSSHKMHPIIVNLLPKEATSSLPLLMRSTLCSSSVEMFVDASLVLLCSSAPSQY